MTALTRYALSLLGRGQTYVPPLLLYAAAVVVLTTNDLGPLAGTYAACALTQFACLVWLTVAVVNAQRGWGDARRARRRAAGAPSP
ncbi:hypothetical protein GCM10009557_90860 [Virgisporangium ochraceum]